MNEQNPKESARMVVRMKGAKVLLSEDRVATEPKAVSHFSIYATAYLSLANIVYIYKYIDSAALE